MERRQAGFCGDRDRSIESIEPGAVLCNKRQGLKVGLGAKPGKTEKQVMRMNQGMYAMRGRHSAWVWLIAMLAGVGLWRGTALGQSAGLQPPIKLGVGARAIALGSSAVAFTQDATAVYWNPAGLDELQRKNLSLFYTQLLGSTSYSFVGYAHPTLELGTFAFGLIHLSTGDITNADDLGNKLGTGTFSRTQFLLSYGKSLPLPISIGATLKVERMQMLDINAGGVGLDLALLYKPDFDSPLLENLVLGFNLQNAVAPRLKLVSELEPQPWRFLAGLSKPIGFHGPNADGVNLLLGVLMAQDEGTRFNIGTEYMFQNRAFLRAGHNGHALNFGAGLVFGNYRLDYAFGKYSNDTADFGPQHRLSLTLEFGKTRTELIELARQQELQRIEEETARKVAYQRKLEFQDLMERGRAYFQQGEYLLALMRFSAARDLFPADAEANQWVNLANEKLNEQRRRELEAVAQRERQQAQEAALQAFIDAQFQKGMQFLEARRYKDAILEWKRGLERDPDNELLKSWIEKTTAEIRKRTGELLAQARQEERRNRITAALEIYDQILEEGLDDDEERKQIEERIAQLRRQLTFNDLFRKGLTEYISKNYREAMKSFEEALRIKPNDPKVKQYLDDAEARANARVEDFANETIRRRFLEAVRLMQQEQYEDALKILEELQKQQRYNKRILDAIDLARERLQQQ